MRTLFLIFIIFFKELDKSLPINANVCLFCDTIQLRVGTVQARNVNRLGIFLIFGMQLMHHK